MKRLIIFIMFILYLFCGAEKCIAGELTSSTSQITPAKIKKMINRQGVKQAVDWLYNNYGDNYGAWSTILENVASGKREWIEVAVLLKPGTDAAPAEMIDSAMGEALENSPKLIFEIIKKGNIFSANDVCTGIDVDDPRFSTYEKAMIAIKHRIEVLEKVDDTNLQDIRTLCIGKIKKSIPYLKEYYGVK